MSGTKYSFKIISKNSSSKLYTFTTRELPDSFPSLFLEKDSTFSFDGYLFFKTQTDPGVHFMLDDKGNIIWYSIADSVLSRPFNLASKQSFLSLSEKNVFHEISFYGDTISTINTGDNLIHHDLLKKDSLYVTLTYQYLNKDILKKNKILDSLAGDGIVVFNNMGEEIWEWNIFDHVDPFSENYVLREDWSHANAISIDRDGHFLISFRNFDQIWKIHSNSGEIIWRLGLNGDFDLNKENIFYQQHAIHNVDDDKLLLFDNGSADFRKSSRALLFTLDSVQNNLFLHQSIFLPDDLFTFKQGSVYQFNDNKYLFSSSTNNKTLITDRFGKILWNLASDESFYRVYYVDK